MINVDEYLEKHNMELNPNRKVVESIKGMLTMTKGYCPCVMEKTDDSICPCKNMREKGKCCCKLYIKKEESY